MIIKDKKLLKENSLNLLAEHFLKLIGLLFGFIALIVALIAGLGIKTPEIYIKYILIGLTAFCAVLFISMLIIYKMKLKNKFKRQKSFEKNFERCNELNNYK